jgi:HPt (histidine-containing phosphotransfer) domain-containing protein
MDSSALAFVVHGLKGELGNLGFTSAYKIASALEEMVKKNNFEKASLTLSELEKEIKWLENFFSNPGWQNLI